MPFFHPLLPEFKIGPVALLLPTNLPPVSTIAPVQLSSASF